MSERMKIMQLKPEKRYEIGHKLHYKDAERIKVMVEKGFYQADIAEIFNVSQTTVSQIATGDIWKWV